MLETGWPSTQGGMFVMELHFVGTNPLFPQWILFSRWSPHHDYDHLIVITLTLLQNWNFLLDPLAYTRHNQGWQTGRWTFSCPAQEIWWEGQCPPSLTHTFLVSNTQTQAFQLPFSGWWHSRMGHYISCSRDGVGICLQKPRALSILAQVAGDCFASRRHVK